MLNMVVMSGRLCRDPELKYTQSGKAVCSFALAVERDVPDRTGKRPADFFECKAWERDAEFVSRYFTKGAAMQVVGRLQNEKYQDKAGNTRTITKIVAENIYFGEIPKSADKPSEAASERESYNRFADMDDDDDGDLPF